MPYLYLWQGKLGVHNPRHASQKPRPPKVRLASTATTEISPSKSLPQTPRTPSPYTPPASHSTPPPSRSTQPSSRSTPPRSSPLRTTRQVSMAVRTEKPLPGVELRDGSPVVPCAPLEPKRAALYGAVGRWLVETVVLSDGAIDRHGLVLRSGVPHASAQGYSPVQSFQQVEWDAEIFIGAGKGSMTLATYAVPGCRVANMIEPWPHRSRSSAYSLPYIAGRRRLQICLVLFKAAPWPCSTHFWHWCPGGCNMGSFSIERGCQSASG